MQQKEPIMRASNTKILIISEVKNRIGYENILRRNNFNNISACEDGVSALQIMEHDLPHVVIADAELPFMDGFELASSLRDIEKTENRFTYFLMISDADLHLKIGYSWQANVDAIIPRDQVPFRLIPQVMSGERLANQTNRLLSENISLQSRCGSLESGQLLDPLTGLGNRRQAMKGMEDTIRQVEARGGAICLLLIKIVDVKELTLTHGAEIVDELIVEVGHKIRRLVRPLDIVSYFDTGLFAVIMQHKLLADCNDRSYMRIKDGLVLKSYQTRGGYLQPVINIGACGAGAESGPPKTACLVATAMSNLSGNLSEELKVSVLNVL